MLNITEEDALRASGADAVYYATRLRGASNERAARELEFRPRQLEWLWVQSKSRTRAFRVPLELNACIAAKVPANGRYGSFALVLPCLEYVRLAGNLGNAYPARKSLP